MQLPYFESDLYKSSSWDNITREERYFCFELFQNIKKDQKKFLSLIKNGINYDRYKNGKFTTESKQLKLKYLESIESKSFDVGVEACFYRDLLKWNGKGIKIFKQLPQKRTFDLALFSENEIIIIEAKAQQGFDTKQMEDFEKDKDYINELFKIIKKPAPKVYIVGIHSSKYTPSPTTKNHFDATITWEQIANTYPNSKALFNRANDIYRDNLNTKDAEPIPIAIGTA